MDYKDHHKVMQALKEAQDVEHDNRQAAREAHLFVAAIDRDWETRM